MDVIKVLRLIAEPASFPWMTTLFSQLGAFPDEASGTLQIALTATSYQEIWVTFIVFICFYKRPIFHSTWTTVFVTTVLTLKMRCVCLAWNECQ